MIVIAGKNDIAVHGLHLAMACFNIDDIILVPNKSDTGVDNWQKSALKLAMSKNIKIKSLSEVYDTKIDHFFSLEFDQIIKPNNLSTKNVYNIHFSKLPEYKGMFTSVWPILFGNKESGVTIHRIDKGIDTGDVIAQSVIEINSSDRSKDLYDNYIKSSITLLSDWFEKIISNDFFSKKQESNNSTYYSKKSIDYSKVALDFGQTAWQLQRYIYAFSFRPYQIVQFRGKGVTDIKITENKSLEKPGALVHEHDDYVVVSTIDYDVKIYFDKLDDLLKVFSSISVEEFAASKFNIIGINDCNSKGWSSIIVAAYWGRTDIIEYCMTQGANINDRNYNGTTVLMYGKDFSLTRNDYSFCKTLLKFGADPFLEDWAGKTIFDYISNEQANLLGLTQ